MNYTHYETRTIAEIIPQLNDEYFIPAIQRPYVWTPDKVERLFDSLLKEYPISTFLVWKPDAEKRSSWHIYEFVQHYQQGSLHSREAELEPLRDPYLVLDGQQRLTSLFIGLSGSYAVRAKGRRSASSNSHIEHRLYLNLLQNPDASLEHDEAEDITYGFEFMAPSKVRKSDIAYWYPVAQVMTLRTSDALDDEADRIQEELEQLGVDSDCRRTANRVLRRLRTMVWEHRCISACIIRNVSYDQVLDIFVRAHEGGEPLSKTDLLMSLVTLNWHHFDARDEIIKYLKHLNTGLTTTNKFNRDFILRTALLCCGHAYVFKVDSFTRENLAYIESNWICIKTALLKAVQLVNSFGLSNDKGNLTSANSIMPISFYIYRLMGKYGDGVIVDEIIYRNRRDIRVWMISCQFTGVFSGAADQTVVRATRTINEQFPDCDDFPAYAISESITTRRKNALFDASRIDDFLNLTGTDRNSRVYLQMLYPHDEWELDERSRELLFKLDDEEIGTFSELDAEDAHLMPNMLLLTRDEREELAALGPTVWLETRDGQQRSFHVLPEPNQYEPTSFASFFKARRKLLENWLQRHLGTRSSHVVAPALALAAVASCT